MRLWTAGDVHAFLEGRAVPTPCPRVQVPCQAVIDGPCKGEGERFQDGVFCRPCNAELRRLVDAYHAARQFRDPLNGNRWTDALEVLTQLLQVFSRSPAMIWENAFLIEHLDKELLLRYSVQKHFFPNQHEQDGHWAIMVRIARTIQAATHLANLGRPTLTLEPEPTEPGNPTEPAGPEHVSAPTHPSAPVPESEHPAEPEPPVEPMGRKIQKVSSKERERLELVSRLEVIGFPEEELLGLPKRSLLEILDMVEFTEFWIGDPYITWGERVISQLETVKARVVVGQSAQVSEPPIPAIALRSFDPEKYPPRSRILLQERVGLALSNQAPRDPKVRTFVGFVIAIVNAIVTPEEPDPRWRQYRSRKAYIDFCNSFPPDNGYRRVLTQFLHIRNLEDLKRSRERGLASQLPFYLIEEREADLGERVSPFRSGTGFADLDQEWALDHERMVSFLNVPLTPRELEFRLQRMLFMGNENLANPAVWRTPEPLTTTILEHFSKPRRQRIYCHCAPFMGKNFDCTLEVGNLLSKFQVRAPPMSTTDFLPPCRPWEGFPFPTSSSQYLLRGDIVQSEIPNLLKNYSQWLIACVLCTSPFADPRDPCPLPPRPFVNVVDALLHIQDTTEYPRLTLLHHMQTIELLYSVSHNMHRRLSDLMYEHFHSRILEYSCRTDPEHTRIVSRFLTACTMLVRLSVKSTEKHRDEYFFMIKDFLDLCEEEFAGWAGRIFVRFASDVHRPLGPALREYLRETNDSF